MQRQQCVSGLIRLLSKDTGGSRHYTGWGKNTIANHSRKMLGLQSEGRGGRQKVQEREREEALQDEVMALMYVLSLGVTLGLRRGQRTSQ